MHIYRFNSRTYTSEEIYQTGVNHRETGTKYYPPRRWGFDDDESGRSSHPADCVYDRGWNSTTKYRKPEPTE